MTEHLRLRHALRADIGRVVDVWVDAFTGDPFLRWLAGGEEGWPAFGAAWLTFVAELTFERGHTYLDRGGNLAVAWIPPDVAFAGPDDIARGRAVIASHAGEGRADDALSTILAARAHTIDTPHWTLQYVGVRSHRRGTGVGAAAVAPILQVCDGEGLPCGLISTNPRNVSFYERLGFRVVTEVPTPDGSAVLRPMHRTPGAGAAG